MFINQIFAAGALVSLAAAIPLHQHQEHHHLQKRDVVWTTKIVEDVVTVQVTTTIYGSPAGATSAAQPPPPAPAPPAEGQQGGDHHHHHHKQQTTVLSTIHVHPTPAPPAAQTTQAAAPSAPPAPPTSQMTSATSAASAPPAPSDNSGMHGENSGGSAPSGQKFTGDITYYTPGLGSCGVTNTESDMIVALAEDIMSEFTGNPNDNPNCGKSITISHGGKTAVATIQDTCPGCAGHSLDLTPTLFQKFADLAEGRVSGVEWWFN